MRGVRVVREAEGGAHATAPRRLVSHRGAEDHNSNGTPVT